MIEIEIQQELEVSLEEETLNALRSFDGNRLIAWMDRTVKDRTTRGEFLEGSSPGAASYSTNPLARPAGGLPQSVYDAVDDTQEGNSYFLNDGSLWVVIHGGYKRLRELMGLQSDRVDLFVTGQMLSATRGRTEIKGHEVTIEYGYLEGMSPSDEMRIAEYHNRLGAGRSKVIRRFLGLTKDERGKAVEIIRQAFESGSA